MAFSGNPYPPMSDLGSTSMASHFSGLSTSIAPSASVSQAPAQPTHHDITRSLIIAALEIDPVLTDRSPAVATNLSLFDSFARYKGIIQAQHNYGNMIADKTWIHPRQKEVDIIHLFIGKSLWHKTWKVLFDLSKYPDMRAWLENRSDWKSDKEVWGLIKKTKDGVQIPYNRQDLHAWRKNGGTLKVKNPKKVKADEAEDKSEKVSKQSKDKGKGKERESSPKAKHHKSKKSSAR